MEKKFEEEFKVVISPTNKLDFCKKDIQTIMDLLDSNVGVIISPRNWKNDGTAVFIGNSEEDFSEFLSKKLGIAEEELIAAISEDGKIPSDSVEAMLGRSEEGFSGIMRRIFQKLSTKYDEATALDMIAQESPEMKFMIGIESSKIMPSFMKEAFQRLGPNRYVDVYRLISQEGSPADPPDYIVDIKPSSVVPPGKAVILQAPPEDSPQMELLRKLADGEVTFPNYSIAANLSYEEYRRLCYLVEDTNWFKEIVLSQLGNYIVRGSGI